jgi:hypothetical protein
MANRIKGQETNLSLIQNGQIVSEIAGFAIKSSDLSFMQDILSEGFLGETTNRKDQVFNGVSGSFQFQITTPAVFVIIGAILDKSRRRTPGAIFNFRETFNFDNGRKAIVTVGDISFGEIPVSNGGRVEYIGVTFSFEASEALVAVL